MDKLIMVCNAHLDIEWQWSWPEAVGECLSTFRIAADFCDRYEGFVFNHNEAILYQYCERYDPELFRRIQGLVKAGKWHIMGGWYIQPDCNMPSGEAFAREALIGKNYFREKFGVEPEVAINFDPFGHSRGLAQVLARSGYKGYLFCRPDPKDCLPLPGVDFIWVGYDGSEVLAHHSVEQYPSFLGQVDAKVRPFLAQFRDKEVAMLLWGVGNHGGGPSVKDMELIAGMQAELREQGLELVHGTPEDYFTWMAGQPLEKHAGHLNAWAPGCYTSQIRIKQEYRALEAEIFRAEKMMSHAAAALGMPYRAERIREALEDLMLIQFHDVLCGTCIQTVEEECLRIMGHGREICQRIATEAMFLLARGQAKAQPGDVPVMVYNPHPYPIEQDFQFEFQPERPESNAPEGYLDVAVTQDGQPLRSQIEKEEGNMGLDWRKRVVAHAVLAPMQVTRLECRPFRVYAEKPTPCWQPENGLFTVAGEDITVAINAQTGLMDRYCVQGRDLIRPGAFLPQVLFDSEDPWECFKDRFNDVEGCFSLMNPGDGSRFSGLRENVIPSVRVVEDGPVRVQIEAVLAYKDSRACITYRIPRKGTEVEVEFRVFWNEKGRMLKLAVPAAFAKPAYLAQVAWGVEEMPTDGKECVAQQWGLLTDGEAALSLINDGTYGSDASRGALRVSLIRSAGYSALPTSLDPPMRQDRFATRIDQGERRFTFWLNGGAKAERLAKLDREAQVRHEKPFYVPIFPASGGERPLPLMELEGEGVTVTALKQAEDGKAYILRLYNGGGQPVRAKTRFPVWNLEYAAEMTPYQARTFRIEGREIRETNSMEG